MNNDTIKKSLLAIVIVGVFGTGTVQADPIVKMKFYKQSQSNWCWAATALSSIRYIYGKVNHEDGLSQCKIVNKFKKPGIDCCVKANAKKTKCNQPGSIADPLNVYAVLNKQISGQLTDDRFDLLIKELKAKRPIPASIRWVGKDVGHAIIVYGLGFPGFAGGQAIYIDDPTTGKQAAMQDKNELSKYGSNANGSWKAMYRLKEL